MDKFIENLEEKERMIKSFDIFFTFLDDAK